VSDSREFPPPSPASSPQLIAPLKAQPYLSRHPEREKPPFFLPLLTTMYAHLFFRPPLCFRAPRFLWRDCSSVPQFFPIFPRSITTFLPEVYGVFSPPPYFIRPPMALDRSFFHNESRVPPTPPDPFRRYSTPLPFVRHFFLSLRLDYVATPSSFRDRRDHPALFQLLSPFSCPNTDQILFFSAPAACPPSREIGP